MIVSCCALMAALCDLGDPGWGDPWFPHNAVLLHSLDGIGIVFFVVPCSFCLFIGCVIPIPELIQCYHLTLIISL